jgi:cell division inhibitor SulA/protein ImuA
LVPSGFEAIDAALGGGWPTPALIEILTDVYGIGELQLVLPLLSALSLRPPQPALILWLNPPYFPNAVALAQHGLSACQHWVETNLSPRDTLWAMEQALRAGACSAVMAWAPAVKAAGLRRLKLATSSSASIGILYRTSTHASQPSPATLRLLLSCSDSQLRVSLFKIQGRKSREVTLDVERRQRLQRAQQ